MFIFKGISSEDMQVVVEEEQELLGRASQRYIQTDIPGMDGAEFEEQGYTTLNKNIKFYILNENKIDSILDWLDGVGILEMNNRVTNARFYAEANPKRTGPIYTIDTTFIRDPFWTKKNDDFVKVDSSVLNAGNVYSNPIIKLVKKTSNTIDLTVNDIRFDYEFNNDEYVLIDCKSKEIRYEGLRRERQSHIGFDFPKLNKGINNVVIHSGDAEVYIKRKDSWR